MLTCEYQDPDRQVRDQFVVGLHDEKLQEKLQFMSSLTLTKAVDYARRYEMVQGQLKEQHVKSEANLVRHPRGFSGSRGGGSSAPRGTRRGRG